MPIRSEAQRAAAIDRLLDRAELAELAARYARAVDRGDRDLLLSLYHADAIDHHGNDFRGSPAQFADYVQGATATFEVTAHYILNSSYEIDGDRADGELYFVAYHRMRPPEPDERAAVLRADVAAEEAPEELAMAVEVEVGSHRGI